MHVLLNRRTTLYEPVRLWISALGAAFRLAQLALRLIGTLVAVILPASLLAFIFVIWLIENDLKKQLLATSLLACEMEVLFLPTGTAFGPRST